MSIEPKTRIKQINQDSLSSIIEELRKVFQSNERPDYEMMLERHYYDWLNKGDIVIDIGAHKARHLKHFCSIVGETGKVIAFEPIPSLYGDLNRMFLNLPILTLHNVALSDRSGNTEFIINEGALGESGLKERIYNDPSITKIRKIDCQIETLDSFTKELPKVDFIKIDIEGGEIGCLNGAKETIRKFRPLISTEYGYNSYHAYDNKIDTLYKLAAEMDYILYDIFLNSLEKIENWNMACDSVYWDYFMVPREKEMEFLKRIRKKPLLIKA